MKAIHSLITICDFTFNEFVILTLSGRGLISQINESILTMNVLFGKNKYIESLIKI